MPKLKPEELYVFDELENLLPPASEDEIARLKDSILNGDGFRDPIIYWANPPDNKPCIVDGHRRYRLYMSDPDVGDISPSTKGMRFKDLDAVKEWMLKTQLERRNLTLAERDTVLARLLELEKSKSRPVGRPAENPEKSRAKNGAQSEPHFEATGRATERVAQETGVSNATVKRAEKRDAERRQARVKIAKADPRFDEQLADGQFELSDADLRALGKMKQPDIKEAVKLIRIGKPWKPQRKSKPKSQKSTAKASAKPATRHQIFKPLLDSIGKSGRELTTVEKAISDTSSSIREHLNEAMNLAVAWKESK